MKEFNNHQNFIKNEYYYEYIDIILNSKYNVNQEYENHHILPKSLKGSNDSDNIAHLLLSEHYKVHTLLPFFTIGSEQISMSYAWHMMANMKRGFVNHEEYSKLKTQWSKINANAMKIRWSGLNNPAKTKPKIGDLNGMYGKNHTQKSKDKMSKVMKEIYKTKIHWNSSNIQVFNEKDELIFDTFGDLKTICEEYDISYTMLQYSWKNYGKKMYMRSKKYKNHPYKGWYAIKNEDKNERK